MAEIRHLSKAPIREALIDLRIAPQQPTKDVFENSCINLEANYPIRKPLHSGELKFHPTGELPPSQTHRPSGYRLESEDKKNVAQFRVDGFTFSRLEPYQSWESLRDEAMRLWDVYRKCSAPKIVSRVALRYINVLRIPIPIDLGDYLTAAPEVPKELPQFVEQFITRVVFRKSTLDARCILTQALEGVDNKHAAIVVDADVIHEGVYPPGSEQLWDRLEQLREFKNLVFFSSITERTVELLK